MSPILPAFFAQVVLQWMSRQVFGVSSEDSEDFTSGHCSELETFRLSNDPFNGS